MSNADDRRTDVRIRRAPKYPAFLIGGAGLGVVVALVLTATRPVDPAVGFGALFGYFALFGVTLGMLVGAVIAIILDRRSTRAARTLAATVDTVDPAPDPE